MNIKYIFFMLLNQVVVHGDSHLPIVILIYDLYTSTISNINNVVMSSTGLYQSIATNFNGIYISSDSGNSFTQSTLNSSSIMWKNGIAISADGKYQTAVSNNNPVINTLDYQVGTGSLGLISTNSHFVALPALPATNTFSFSFWFKYVFALLKYNFLNIDSIHHDRSIARRLCISTFQSGIQER